MARRASRQAGEHSRARPRLGPSSAVGGARAVAKDAASPRAASAPAAARRRSLRAAPAARRSSATRSRPARCASRPRRRRAAAARARRGSSRGACEGTARGACGASRRPGCATRPEGLGGFSESLPRPSAPRAPPRGAAAQSRAAPVPGRGVPPVPGAPCPPRLRHHVSESAFRSRAPRANWACADCEGRTSREAQYWRGDLPGLRPGPSVPATHREVVGPAEVPLRLQRRGDLSQPRVGRPAPPEH